MKIIEKGNTRIKCCRCGCIFEWEKEDLKNAFGIEYLKCPYCGHTLILE